MKIKDGFLLRTVAGQHVVLPESETLNLNMMITLNETGAFLWEQLQKEATQETLVQALLEEYDVDRETAAAAVSAFVKKLEDNGFLA